MGYNALNIGFTNSGSIATGDVVELTGDNTVAVTSASSTKVVGVAYGPNTTEGVTVQTDGIAKVVASAAIAAGAIVVSATAGKVATIGAGTFDARIGRALTAAATDGDVIEVLLD